MSGSILVIYGTESGNAEMAADEIMGALAAHDIQASGEEMSDTDVDALEEADTIVVVCSTYEEGELPASAQPLYEAIKQENPDLSSVSFHAFGLGDSSYEHFCGGIETISDALVEAGATLLGEIEKNDSLSGEAADEQAVAWIDRLVEDGSFNQEPRSQEEPGIPPEHEEVIEEPKISACPFPHDQIQYLEMERDDSGNEIRGINADSNIEVDGELFRWNDKEFQKNPYPYYARARKESPVHYAGDNTYVVTRYDDVMEFFKLPMMSIKAPETSEHNPFESAFDETVLSMDPPEHARSRRLFSRWFTPKLIKQWIKYTDEAMDKILGRYNRGDVIDGHFALGADPTHETMSRILDLDPGEVEPLFWALWDGMMIQATDPTPGTWEKSATAVEYMFNRTEALLLDKVENPGNGLADELIAKYKEGEITWNEVLQNTVNFYMSGAPNPAYLIGSALEVFANHPEVMRSFRDHPETRSKIIDEVARLNPVELLLTRFPKEDVVIRGVRIPAESCIKFPIGAVNRDPDVFEDPDVFNLNRPNEASRHLTFGLGTHACAGQAIARAEAEVILARVAQEFDTVEVLDEPVRVVTDRLIAYKSLPMAFS